MNSINFTQFYQDWIYTKISKQMPINRKEIQNAVCSFKEALKQISAQLPIQKQVFCKLGKEQLLELFEKALCTPLVEQALFQGLLQDVILTRLPKSLLPRYEQESVNSTIAKLFRAMITAGAYTGYQLIATPGPHDQEKLLSTFAGGLFYSFIKETDLSMLGSAATQILLSGFAHYPHPTMCT